MRRGWEGGAEGGGEGPVRRGGVARAISGCQHKDTLLPSNIPANSRGHRHLQRLPQPCGRACRIRTGVLKFRRRVHPPPRRKRYEHVAHAVSGPKGH